MPLPILLAALALGQEPTAPVSPFQAAPFVAETTRLALTPDLDGKIGEEEWDPFTNGPQIRSFLQWEPYKVHIGAIVPSEHDLLLSFDFENNGWLVGADNVEVRVSFEGGAPKVVGRRLDVLGVEGPTWVDLPGIAMSAKAVAKSNGDTVTYEVTLSDPSLGLFPGMAGGRPALRIDSVAADTDSFAPYLPRLLSPVDFAFRRSAALPEGLKWNPENVAAVVQPGNELKVRYNFVGDEALGLKSLAIRSEGEMRDATTQVTVPFPLFDKKRRALVDWKSMVRQDTRLGWYILQGSLESNDGLTAMMQTSYRVAPVVDVAVVRERVTTKTAPSVRRVVYYIRSNSVRRVEGNVTITPPTGFQLVGPPSQKFSIFEGRGESRRTLELVVPPESKGTFPIRFRVEVGEKVVEEVGFLHIN